MTTIKIKDDEFKLKYTIRAIFTYEQIKGKAFVVESLMDSYLLIYSFLTASNPDKELSFDDFLDACDEDPTILSQFQSFFEAEQNKQALGKTPKKAMTPVKK